jgi:hypothetical protein
VLLEQLETLVVREDGAVLLARLQTAALADEEGRALARELTAIEPVSPRTILPLRSGAA